MKAKKIAIYFMGTMALLLLTQCTDTPSVLIDVEPSLSVLSGSVAATQNLGKVAQLNPKLKPQTKFPQLFGLVQEAYAATPDCPAVNGNNSPTSYCDNETLVTFYDNCQSTSMQEPGLRRMYTRLTFSSPALCTLVNTNGFTSGVLPSLAGETVTRTYGMGAGGDQNNIRFSTSTNEAAYIYSDYPSGWKEDRTGGISITFDSVDPTIRTIVVNGAQAKSVLHLDDAVPDTTSFDLLNIVPPGTSKQARVIWDHTINTVKTGDELLEIGPQVIGSPSSSVEFSTGLSTNTTAPFDGDIVMSGTTVKKGALLRSQHNIALGIGLILVTDDLVWGDSNCCWPTSGTVRGEHDRNLPSGSLTETLVFTGASCGKIEYTTISGKSIMDQLHHCF